MKTIYGDIPKEVVASNIDDLIGQIFKLLPYKESNNENLNYHFSTLLFRLTGLTQVLNSSPELLTVISILEAARTETDFKLYRKAVLDSCSILKKIQVKYNARSI